MCGILPSAPRPRNPPVATGRLPLLTSPWKAKNLVPRGGGSTICSLGQEGRLGAVREIVGMLPPWTLSLFAGQIVFFGDLGEQISMLEVLSLERLRF